MVLQKNNYLNTSVSPEKQKGQQVRFYYNYLKYDIPSYRCKPRDIITVRDEQKKSKSLVQNYLDSSIREELPKHLTLNPFQYQGSVNQIIDRKWVVFSISQKFGLSISTNGLIVGVGIVASIGI
ncbi:hypothetical protein F8388_019854 [Cannabis sativa]|uniref:Uncharacterized protein n=1 Tax=Cannabis sativa TaxID=3483 RepID=A0A7J6HNN0_CANSA|nr:hypothetical protein F8388_019854 [Cannabis sativa]